MTSSLRPEMVWPLDTLPPPSTPDMECMAEVRQDLEEANRAADDLCKATREYLDQRKKRSVRNLEPFKIKQS